MVEGKELEVFAENWDEENEKVLFGVKDDEEYIRELMIAKFELERSVLTGVTFDAEAEAELEKRGILGTGNIVGVGISEKKRGGRPTGRLGLTVYVVKKPKEKEFSIASDTEIPDEFNGIKTDVVEIGVIEAFKSQPFVDSNRYPRPVPCGCSVGHINVTAGTLGCLVKRGRSMFILSNNHVLANLNRARRGDPIIQPGRADGGSDPRNRIGRLSNFIPIRMGGPSNLVDAAIALTTQVRPEILQIGRPNRIPIPPSRGMSVKKRGRTTELTTNGIIEDVNLTVRIDYRSAGWALFRNQILIRKPGFSAGGDSGSLIVDHQNRPVGLLFAGNAITGTTIANRISVVLHALGVQIF